MSGYSLPSGTILGESYEIRGLLGSGGFGITYKAWDEEFHRVVAIKEYFPFDLAMRASGSYEVVPRDADTKDDFEKGMTQFVEEGRTLAKFADEHIVRATNFVKENGTVYMVMEYQEGCSLSEFLEDQEGPLSEQEILKIFVPVMRALEKVHQAHILHRDLKPDNIYIRKNGAPLLLDFGAARQKIVGKTRSMTSMLSPGYAPLEQYHARGNQGPWTDIYALGATMYYCTTGRRPEDVTARVAASSSGMPDPMPPAEKAGSGTFSATLLITIDWMLKLSESARPQSLSEVLTQLSGIESRPKGGTSSSLARTKRVTASVQGKDENISIKTEKYEYDSAGASRHSSKSHKPVVVIAVVGLLVVLFMGIGFVLWSKWADQRTIAGRQPTPEETPGQVVSFSTKQDNNARLAEEKRKADEAARLAEEKRKADEAARLAEEKRRADEAARLAEEKRKADEAARLAEEKRRADEAARLAEEKRRADEAARLAEEKRRADEAARLAEEKRKADEAARLAEEKRKADEAARLAEEKRKADEAARLADEKRKADEAARLAEEKRKADEAARLAEEKRKADEAARLAEEKRKADEAARLAEEKRKADEAARLAEEKRKADEAARLAEEKRRKEEKSRLLVEPAVVRVGNFSIGKYEVTQGQWGAIMGNKPSYFSKGDDYPVESVSWNEVQEYIRRLNMKTGKQYRLPTEGEWFKACLGGEAEQRYCGGKDLDRVAWYQENSDGSTQPVGRKRANQLGIYDLSGNVWEWTSSLYQPEDERRVIRGGAWFSPQNHLDASYRFRLNPDFGDYNVGFRIAHD